MTNMLVLITYDVNTEDAAGRKRLNKIAKTCVAFGQRVQNSVFECLLESDDLAVLKHKILCLMDMEKDSVRFYNLGQKYATKIEHYGIKASYEPEGLLVL